MKRIKRKLFYGWINVAVLWFSYGAVVASITYAFGVVVSDMAKDLHMTMTIATGAYTGYTFVHAVTAPLAGKYIEKHGAKRSMLLGLGLLLTGCLMLAVFENSVTVYYLFWLVFVGVGMRFGTLLPSQVNISKWFFDRRGMAMSVYLTAGGIGGYIFAPLCTVVNEKYSWRGVWTMIAGLTALAMLFVASVIVEEPQTAGEPSDRANDEEKGRNKRNSNNYKTTAPWKLHAARREAVFYMLVYLYFASSYQLSAITSQGMNHLVLEGISRSAAAGAVGLFAFINTFGRIAVGVLGERFDTKKIMVIGALLSIAGFSVLAGAKTKGDAYCALTLSGIGYGVLMVGPQNLLLNYFGSHDYANINGLYAMIAGILSAVPTVVIGGFFDITGNYYFAWILGIMLMVLSLIIVIVMKPPRFKGNLQNE